MPPPPLGGIDGEDSAARAGITPGVPPGKHVTRLLEAFGRTPVRIEGPRVGIGESDGPQQTRQPRTGCDGHISPRNAQCGPSRGQSRGLSRVPPTASLGDVKDTVHVKFPAWYPGPVDSRRPSGPPDALTRYNSDRTVDQDGCTAEASQERGGGRLGRRRGSRLDGDTHVVRASLGYHALHGVQPLGMPGVDLVNAPQSGRSREAASARSRSLPAPGMRGMRR